MANMRGNQILPDTLIREAIRCIEVNEAKIAFVVDTEGKLIGSVSDGDIRRGLLGGKNLQTAVSEIMNTAPAVVHINDDREKILRLITVHDHRYIPVVDSENRIHRIETVKNFLDKGEKDNWVFLMAGGFGTRLKPLTETRPKPLLHVGNKPILESILESFIANGFKKFFISVHYKASMVKDHFGNGDRWGVKIRYVYEDEPLGTAGALGLLPEVPGDPLILMNGDILTKVNFEHLLDFHNEHQSMATMCVREYDFQVPYGTVKVDGHRVTQIVEKPVHTFFVNAGIYVLEPAVLKNIAKNTCKDMPDLLDEVRTNTNQVSVFPIHEYWLDIGKRDDFDRAQTDYVVQFE